MKVPPVLFVNCVAVASGLVMAVMAVGSVCVGVAAVGLVHVVVAGAWLCCSGLMFCWLRWEVVLLLLLLLDWLQLLHVLAC